MQIPYQIYLLFQLCLEYIECKTLISATLKPSTKKRSLKHDNKLDLRQKHLFLSNNDYGVASSLPIILGSLWPEEVVQVGIPDKYQIYLLEKKCYLIVKYITEYKQKIMNSYLKPFKYTNY